MTEYVKKEAVGDRITTAVFHQTDSGQLRPYLIGVFLDKRRAGESARVIPWWQGRAWTHRGAQRKLDRKVDRLARDLERQERLIEALGYPPAS
jgi:hypothetical protein